MKGGGCRTNGCEWCGMAAGLVMLVFTEDDLVLMAVNTKDPRIIIVFYRFCLRRGLGVKCSKE